MFKYMFSRPHQGHRWQVLVVVESRNAHHPFMKFHLEFQRLGASINDAEASGS